MAPPPSDIPEDEEQFLDDVEAFYHERGYCAASIAQFRFN